MFSRTFKSSLLLFVLLFKLQTLNSQTQIKGTVIDSIGAPVPFCALALLHAKDSSIAKGNFCDEQGRFEFTSVPGGTYVMRIVYSGYTPLVSSVIPLDSSQQNISLPPFVLKSSALLLKEVSVSVFKPTIEFKNGNTVLNVENNLVAGGNTVLELLKRIPGVSVDNQNNITINGKSGVRFLINGRLQYLSAEQMVNMLNGMNAETVATIELIKNPPAKYDAAGTAGLINIVLKKGKLKGFNGNLYEVAGKGIFFRSTTVANLNFKSNKWSVFSNFTYMNLNMGDYYKFHRTVYGDVIKDVINEDGTDKIHREALTGNIGLEYELNPKTTLGLNVNAGPNNANHVQASKITIPTGTLFPYYLLNNASSFSENFNNPSINLNAIHQLDTLGSQIQVSADFTNYLAEEKKNNTNRFFDLGQTEVLQPYGNLSETNRDFKIVTQKIDLNKMLKKNKSVELGFKNSYADNQNDFILQQTNDTTGLYYLDKTFSNNYHYTESILAGYVTFHHGFRKVNWSLGLRGEQTNVHAAKLNSDFRLNRNYFNFFPSAGLDIAFNKHHSIQSSYSYRLDRPDYASLNPTRVFWDRLDYRAGNPFLVPQYSHNLNLDYNYKGFLTNSLGFIQTSNCFFFYSYTNPNTRINTDTLVNMGVRNNLAYTLFLQKQIRAYQFQFTGVALYRGVKGTLESEDASSQSFFYSLSLNNEWILPKEFKIQMYAMYNSPIRESLQLYMANSSVNVVLQKSFFNKSLFVALGIHDVFYQELTGITTDFSNQKTLFYMKNDTRRMRLSLNYKFGKMKFQQKTLKSNEEESNRLKGSGK